MGDTTARTDAKAKSTGGNDLHKSNVPAVSIRKIDADGVHVFYRAAGDPNAPVTFPKRCAAPLVSE